MRGATRVLAVEDDPGVAAALASLLRDHGYEVEGAATGRAAVARIDAAPYDACVLDIVLPNILLSLALVATGDGGG